MNRPLKTRAGNIQTRLAHRLPQRPAKPQKPNRKNPSEPTTHQMYRVQHRKETYRRFVKMVELSGVEPMTFSLRKSRNIDRQTTK